MAKLPLDLSKYKKIAHDDHKIVMQHPEGHEIHISTKALSPKMRGDFAALPTHGDPKPDESKLSASAKEVEDDSLRDEGERSPNENKPMRLAEGTDEPIADKAPDAGDSAPAPQQAAQDAPPPVVVNVNSNPNQMQPVPAGMMPQGQIPQQAAMQPQQPVALPPENPPLDEQKGAIPSLAPQSAPSPADQIQGAIPDALAEATKGYGSNVGGIYEEAKAKGQLGQEETKLLQDQQVRKEALLTKNQQDYAALDQERLDHQQDVQNNLVNPNKYWDDHSKVATGIGLILAGFNPSNKPNAAIEFLQNQMNRSLEAQKANLGAKENLLSATLHQFGNMRDATDMWKVLASDAMATQLQTAAAKAATPMAKAMADQAAGKFRMDASANLMNLKIRQSLINSAQSADQSSDDAKEQRLESVLRVVDPAQAKIREEHYVPGVGFSQREVPQSARENLLAKQQLSSVGQQLYDWTAKHSGSLNPSDINTGKALAANMQNLYRGAINGGVFKKGEQSFIDSIVDSDPTKFFNNIRVLPKLKAVLDTNQNLLDGLKKSYSLPTTSEQQAKNLNPQQQKMVEWAKANPNDIRSGMVLKKLGIQ